MGRLVMASVAVAVVAGIGTVRAGLAESPAGSAVCSAFPYEIAKGRGVSSAEVLALIKTKCAPGDVLEIAPGFEDVVAIACDFRQQVVHAGNLTLCVYQGQRSLKARTTPK